MHSAVALAVVQDAHIAIVDVADVFFAARRAHVTAKSRITFIRTRLRAANAGLRQNRARRAPVTGRRCDIPGAGL